MKPIYYLFVILLFSTCKKKEILVDGNTPYNDTYISTIQIENYVNKLFIDLIGREPLNTEMELEVEALKTAELSEDARLLLIDKLQNNTEYLEGDSSYKQAYYHRFYDVVKIKMLEGIEDDVMREQLGLDYNAYQGAVNSGDSAKAAIKLKDIQEIEDVLNISKDYRNGTTTINEIFIRLIDNYVYDKINMQTFNFINATYQDLFFRYPTEQEYNASFEMIENNSAQYILGQSGTSKGEYQEILMNSREFHEGIIVWTYKSLLIREPSAAETAKAMSLFLTSKNFQELQSGIMKTDEYANFN
ncbi:MAG: hypothetical protein ACPGVH_05670 [Chitinophagales bacterium]